MPSSCFPYLRHRDVLVPIPFEVFLSRSMGLPQFPPPWSGPRERQWPIALKTLTTFSIAALVTVATVTLRLGVIVIIVIIIFASGLLTRPVAQKIQFQILICQSYCFQSSCTNVLIHLKVCHWICHWICL